MPGSSSLIWATIGRIWRIFRSLELPKSRTSPSETFSEKAVKASVVLSQISLSSSIAPLAPRNVKRVVAVSRLKIRSYIGQSPDVNPIEPDQLQALILVRFRWDGRSWIPRRPLGHHGWAGLRDSVDETRCSALGARPEQTGRDDAPGPAGCTGRSVDPSSLMSLIDPVLAQLLPQGGTVDSEDLSGRGAVPSVFLEKGSKDGGFGELQKLFVQHHITCPVVIAQGVPGPRCDLTLDFPRDRRGNGLSAGF